jgi:hypothetical protein
MPTAAVEFKNNLDWGYRFVTIPFGVTVIFGARAIHRSSGPEFLPDRICWNIEMSGRDPLAHWVREQLDAQSWFNIETDVEVQINEANPSFNRTLVYMVRGGYVYITAWENPR